MARKLEKQTLALVEKASCGSINYDTPPWLKRPGKIECKQRWALVCRIYRALTDGSSLQEVMPPREWRSVDGVLRIGNTDRIIEFDEKQHFNCHRLTTLHLYPRTIKLGFDRNVWSQRSKMSRAVSGGGWAVPKPPLFPGPGGRHLQRAFRDALCDLLPDQYDFAPTLRIAHFEVEPWINARNRVTEMHALLQKRGVI